MTFVHAVDELIEVNGSGLVGKASHWERVRLGEIAKVVNGFPFPSKGFNDKKGKPVLRIRDITVGEASSFYEGPTFEAPRVERHDLVIGMDGDFNCCLWLGTPALMNQRVCKVLPDESIYSKRLLAYILPGYLKLVNDHTSAVTVKHLSSRTVQELPLPLPPRAEQDRIVSRIDELFSRIDEGERALKRVQKLVERYRQSVLKAAVTGELTREWRERHKGQLESGEVLLQRILKARREAWEKAELEKIKARGIKHTNDLWKRKYQEGSTPPATSLQELPEGWAWASVEQAGEVKLGRQRAPQHHAGDHMRPYLRVANVYEDRLDLSDVMEMNFTPKEFQTYSLRHGDVLLNEGQSPELVGRPAMYRGEIPGCCYQKTLLRFRAYAGISAEFALLVFRAYLHSGRFRRSSNITTSIAHLAAERFVRIEFPVPSEAEQAEIVEVASRKLSVVSHLEGDLTSRLVEVQGLRQSVLNAAFSGRLVPQEPTDEPALTLLQRIAPTHEPVPANAGRRKSSRAA